MLVLKCCCVLLLECWNRIGKFQVLTFIKKYMVIINKLHVVVPNNFFGQIYFSNNKLWCANKDFVNEDFAEHERHTIAEHRCWFHVEDWAG